MIVYSYDPWLVAASVAISLMASFTGLSLTRGISGLVESQRQLRIIMASIALGAGIWSMHFVAMLAMRFPVPVFYDLLQTTASALVAILMAGVALVLMHFGPRTRPKTVLAGVVLGLGIAVMHYVGLGAMDGCRPVYRPAGFIVAGTLAGAMGVAAIAIAYGQRSARNTAFATLVFGASVVVVHFSAMHWTDFVEASRRTLEAPAMSNAEIALVVLLSGFVISGAFLLTAASVLNRPMAQGAGDAPVAGETPSPAAQPTSRATAPRVPFERDGATYFVPAHMVAAIRAEGHYSVAYTAEGRVFCPWSISQAEARLPAPFLRVHRSYLVNTAHVTGFERRKDNGVCLMEGTPGLGKVPVARARISAVREALGI
ncbi:MHYT domain-containing protein [Alkalilacustris brevis]|uniref:MHYT domain-containing protein n=1 Tax=Alkalilacustris brevis TaxID=2026338 RepID=UPI000E0D4EFA|nr:MHYT domain-containing protein [Alkalilacustris brevis]